jgi:hypothetical protein
MMVAIMTMLAQIAFIGCFCINFINCINEKTPTFHCLPSFQILERNQMGQMQSSIGCTNLLILHYVVVDLKVGCVEFCRTFSVSGKDKSEWWQSQDYYLRE